jgi:hypothetical protein
VLPIAALVPQLVWVRLVFDWQVPAAAAACYARPGPNIFQAINLPGPWSIVRCYDL